MTSSLKIASTSGFTIEKGIPLPRRNFGEVYPFLEMQVGDSVLVPPKAGESDQTMRGRVSAAIAYVGRKVNAKYATRKVEGGRRVWRIS